MTKYLVLFAAAIIFVILFRIFFSWYSKRQKSQNQQVNRTNSAEGKKAAVCPVCNSALGTGENLFSKVYRPMNVPDQYCTISGCPHCFPVTEAGLERECPVCGKKVESDGYLVARLFNYADGKKHVHVTGCKKCCSGKFE